MLTGTTIFESILAEVNESPVFSILIDETMDIVTTEQMIVYIKYIVPVPQSEPAIKTRFLGMIQVSAFS